MDAEEFRDALTACGWGNSAAHPWLCDTLHCNDRLLRRWLAGRQPVPDRVAVWLRATRDHMRAHPCAPPPHHVTDTAQEVRA